MWRVDVRSWDRDGSSFDVKVHEDDRHRWGWGSMRMLTEDEYEALSAGELYVLPPIFERAQRACAAAFEWEHHDLGAMDTAEILRDLRAAMVSVLDAVSPTADSGGDNGSMTQREWGKRYFDAVDAAAAAWGGSRNNISLNREGEIFTAIFTNASIRETASGPDPITALNELAAIAKRKAYRFEAMSTAERIVWLVDIGSLSSDRDGLHLQTESGATITAAWGAGDQDDAILELCRKVAESDDLHED